VYRTRVALVVALAVHVAAFVFMPRSRPNAVPKSPSESMTVDLEPTVAGGAGGGGHAEGETIAMARSYGHVTRRATVPTAPEVTAAPETTSEETSLALPEPSYTHGSIGLSGAGSYRFDALKQHPEANEAAEIADNVNHAIMDPIRAHESENGSLASGPIVNELESTTRHLAGSPFEGRAVLAFRIDELGLVVSASVEDVSGDRLAWEEVAKKTFNALAQKRLVIPHGSKGVAMRVELTSKVALPSGARHAMSVASPAVDAVGNVLHGQFDRPVDTPGIVAGSFDVSDIGAHPARVVGARVLSETVF
jgi:hypothetical protein